ncbi:hypothetical protein [Methanosarcina mazei]|uniref:Glycine zipper-like domain-containing protein n=1 Tax=Methanosarcina mazei S-6 TaxID=213585 RepID=A0A0E3RJD5_METMZ|nr:hypothetical protein [Methanosarcina mazei]AKB65342.1 hypothetical protein MSMAS_2146 [Methanosarcina mazei S-6]
MNGKDKENVKEDAMGSGLAIGMSLGLIFGALMNNIALGVAFGPVIGIALGALFQGKKEREYVKNQTAGGHPTLKDGVCFGPPARLLGDR